MNLLERYYKMLFKPQDLIERAVVKNPGEDVKKAIYSLSNDERSCQRRFSEYASLPATCYPNWSLPHHVEEVKNNRVTIRSIDTAKTRTTAKNRVRRLLRHDDQRIQGENLIKLYFKLATHNRSNVVSDALGDDFINSYQ